MIECEKKIKGYDIVTELAYKYITCGCLCGPVIFRVFQHHYHCIYSKEKYFSS